MSRQGSKPSLLQVVGSVLAAAFGVQSSTNRERDFASGSATAYIIAGVVFTAVFIFVLLAVIKLILR
jgi:hypothetical protein